MNKKRDVGLDVLKCIATIMVYSTNNESFKSFILLESTVCCF